MKSVALTTSHPANVYAYKPDLVGSLAEVTPRQILELFIKMKKLSLHHKVLFALLLSFGLGIWINLKHGATFCPGSYG